MSSSKALRAIEAELRRRRRVVQGSAAPGSAMRVGAYVEAMAKRVGASYPDEARRWLRKAGIIYEGLTSREKERAEELWRKVLKSL